MGVSSARQRIIVPFAGHVIGEGFNSLTVERVGTALDVGEPGEDPVAPGQTASFKFLMVTSQSHLERALSIGVELEARYALFSAGGKFDFAEQSALNTTSTYIVASCVVKNALRFGRDFRPNQSAAALIAAADRDGFTRAFGDRFTQALHTGGEFHALVRITSSKMEHQRQIAASLHGEYNGLVTSVSFSASLQSAANDKEAHTEVSVQVHQTGGVGDQVQIPGTEANKIRDHMNSFATAAHTNAAAFRAELLTYDTLALPFPSTGELDDRRRVLEDCLRQRQAYWSALSDLEYAQTEHAPLIFQDLPPAEVLLDLQNAVRQILNDLMAHARNVSTGVIEPALFVPVDPPVLPRFKRRTTGSFASWWTRRTDPNQSSTLLSDELVLIDKIAQKTRGILSVPPEEASPETMERAADTITELDVSHDPDETLPPLRSLAALPSMIDAPLRELTANDVQLADLTGLEPFTRLAMVNLDRSQVRDITALSSAAGIGELHLLGNNVSDLSPLRAHTGMEFLYLAGNRIQSLDPLRAMPELHVLSIARLGIRETEQVFLENPITDARALAALPRLANPVTSTDTLRLRFIHLEGTSEQQATVLATRIGTTSRFRVTADGSDVVEEGVLLALYEVSDLAFVPAPIVLIGLRFRHIGMHAVAATRPDDRAASMPAEELRDLFLDESFTAENTQGQHFIRTAVGLAPELFVEFGPA